ncbi:hypothetical protein AADG42_14965 [Ammonicoccus fulvus]|uniref:DUF4352 domain-containing protein n=1 Tax=Ammonicoccus fulvus TaxID=3138240 RepID=A0ABZ3FR44_9ACTN
MTVLRRPRLLLAGAVAILALALIALVGGFAEAGPRHGPSRTPGERMVGHRWAVVVHEASVVRRYDTSPPQLQLRLDLENVTDAYLAYQLKGLITVEFPDGTRFDELSISNPGNGYGNPGFVTPVEATIRLEELPPGDVPIRVTVRDERAHRSWVTSDNWRTTAVLGHVDLIARDLR